MSERRSGDHGPARAAGTLRVAIDATPLLGRPTGVGAFCAGVLGRLAEDPSLSILAYALSWRGRNGLLRDWNHRDLQLQPHLHQRNVYLRRCEPGVL